MNTKIIQIGAGGNGSWLVPHICRIMGLNGVDIYDYTIYDGDVVEEKNLLRQNFSQRDLGKNKAEALASRYSSIYGSKIVFVTEYFKGEFKEALGVNYIIIGCVDNNKTRKMIEDRYRVVTFSQGIYIDIGNEENWGQIFVSDRSADIFLFDHVKYNEDKHPDELSCAERLESGAQSPIINSYMAVLTANLLYSILKEKKPIDYYKIIVNTNNVITRYLKKDIKKD